MKWLSDLAVARLREAIEMPDLYGTPYRVIRKVGAGGMGTVYLADDTNLNRNVAIKIMNVIDPSGEFATRMLMEARIVARLEHPSIVPVHDVGKVPDGRVYYVMKYVEGRRLDEFATESKSLPDLLRVFQKSCEAVAFANAHGVLHRDLKPENIMVGPFGEVLLMDWGIAKLTGEAIHSARDGFDQVQTLDRVVAEESQTADGVIVGTPAYMSPEQAMGKTEGLDQRTDVYGLGAILYFLLSGQPPAPDIAPARERVSGIEIALRQHSPKIPKQLRAICVKAVASDPGQRYANALDLSADIANFLDGVEVSAYKESFIERGARWAQKNRFLVLLILAYLIMRATLLLVLGR